MAKIKRVFVVEGIDNGKIVGSELIKATNRLLEDEDLEISSSAREKVLEALLAPGANTRVVAFMTHTDFSTYAKPGGVKTFVQSMLRTQADVTQALQMINDHNLQGHDEDWLQIKTGKRMPLSTLNGPEDVAVVLNLREPLDFKKTVNNKEEAQAFLEGIMSHNNFKLALNVDQAKRSVKTPTSATPSELITDGFNFESIISFKERDVRIAAMAEWKKAKEQAATTNKKQVSTNSKIDQLAHALYDELLEILGKHGLPADEPTATGVYTLGKQALNKVFDGLPDEDKKNAKLRFDVRRAAVSKFPRNKDLWLLVLEGHIKDYLERYNEKFVDKTKPPADKSPADAEKVAPSETSDAVKDFGKNLKYGWWIKKSKDQPDKYQVGFSIKEDQSQTATSSPIKKISLDKSGDNGNGIVSIETENSVYTAPVNLLSGVESHEALKHLPNYSSKMKKLDLVDAFIKDFNGTSDDNESSADEGGASTTLPSHVQGALSDYAKNIKKMAGKSGISTKDLLAAINKEIDSAG